jgi:hypothetical protein
MTKSCRILNVSYLWRKSVHQKWDAAVARRIPIVATVKTLMIWMSNMIRFGMMHLTEKYVVGTHDYHKLFGEFLTIWIFPQCKI